MDATRMFNAVVNQMSNWQRNQWARAGYPGLTRKNLMGPVRFLLAKRRVK